MRYSEIWITGLESSYKLFQDIDGIKQGKSHQIKISNLPQEMFYSKMLH